MRISDWSSDVCSSDLRGEVAERRVAGDHRHRAQLDRRGRGFVGQVRDVDHGAQAVHLGHHLLAERTQAVPLALDRVGGIRDGVGGAVRSEEHTSELQSLLRISYAVFCLKNNKTKTVFPATTSPLILNP